MRYLIAAIILIPLVSHTMMIQSVEAQGNNGCFVSLSNAETERGIRHYRSDCKDWYTKIEKLRDYQLDPQEAPWVNVAVVSVDKRSGRLTVSHGPIPEVGLPAMTINAITSNKVGLATLLPGERIEVQCEHSGGIIRIINWRM